MKVDSLCTACESELDLSSASLSASYYYDSLPYCVIDAVFSIGVKYTSTQNVVKNYCTYYGLREYNTKQDNDGDTHTISQLVEHIESMGIEKSADVVFRNHQRTSSRNRILKADAVLRFARILQKYGVETLADITAKGIPYKAEEEILRIPGQRSGLSLRYFYMLSGDDSQAKPDRHVLRFLKEHTGCDYTIQQAQDVLGNTVELLKGKYPHLTVRLLDYSIWDYMAHRRKNKMAKQYHKLVRDRIPEIIEADGKTCICEMLSDKEYLYLLDQKLNEELAEYQESKSLEEMADLLEVMQAVVKARGWTMEQLESLRAEKAAKRGGFEKKLLLKEVIEIEVNPMRTYHSASGSSAEDLFIELFSDTFGAEKASYLYSQYPFSDIYQNSRFADFLIENGGRKVAIEIDDEASHNPKLVSQNKFYDDLLKQNSMIYLGWNVYRWAVRQMQQQPETVKDELRVFLGQHPSFREIEDYLPTQRGKSLDGSQLELKEHQKQALAALEEMRCNFETIALLYHATGTGKTVTAVMDAKRFGKRTLFLAHTVELVDQASKTFRKLWPEVAVGSYVESRKEKEAYVVCGSIQSVALNLEQFKPDDFGYIIVDEAHHASADTYQKVLSYFTPEFTLGLTATPERADDKNILDIFKNTAHKLDIQTAVEIGELVPVRCIRIHTNIDLIKVRFNSVQYNIRDLESKIYVPERNQLIVDTWLQYVKDKRTVIFCAFVKHAQEIAGRLHDAGVVAEAVSGEIKASDRREILARFEKGEVKVLCACDLLNEGWDCPATEVLFMARPTMSKVLYTQQLGRGMRLSPGKESLMVFDFVDNASQYNMPYSMHRLFRLKEYKPGTLAYV